MVTEVEVLFKKAAEFLNVSEEFLEGVLSRGELAYEQRDAERYIKFQDLNDYHDKLQAKRHEIIQEVTQRAAKAGLYKNRKDEPQ